MQFIIANANTLSGSIICPSSCLRDFCDFMSICMVFLGPFFTQINASRRWTPTLKRIQIHFQSGGSALRCIYLPNRGPKVSSICMVFLGPFLTQINASQCWKPILEISINIFPVWQSSIAMNLLALWRPSIASCHPQLCGKLF